MCSSQLLIVETPKRSAWFQIKQLMNKRGNLFYIEIGQLGSYGLTFRTKFNGFYSDDIFEIEDKPIMSVYQNEQDEEYKSNYLVA